MTGPSYPRPAPQSGIGTFVIGVSPIGSIASFDPWVTIISQYANSPRLTSLIERFNEAMDQTQNIDNLYDLIWNIATAQGYGLDVLGRIVGVVRTVQLPPASLDNFGFEEAGSWTGFGQGGFYSGGGVTDNYSLSDTDFRTLIYAKAAANITDGSIPSLNAILMSIFKTRGEVYVADGLDMTLTVTFDFSLTPLELAIVETSGVLPYPCGVVVNIAQP